MGKAIFVISVIILMSLPTIAMLHPTQSSASMPLPLRPDFNKAQLSQRLDRAIPRLMNDGIVPGLSVAIIRDGRVFWHEGFGVKNALTKEPVSDETVFEAASLSKTVFAYAVLKLVDAAMLDLDKPLTEYLSSPYIDNDSRLNLITARRVLTHTTGFPNWRPSGQPLKIVLPPGERFSYSGEGFVYLQKVIEHVTGQPLDAFVKKMVFEPLGMTNSSYVWQPAYQTRKAAGHDAGGNPTGMRKPDAANAAASLQTTSLDYAKFMIAVMKGIGLKQPTSKAMLSPQIQVDEGCRNCIVTPPTGKFSPYVSWGLGVGIQQTKDGLSFWHWGDNTDVQCYMLGYPQRELGIVVFTNSGNGLAIVPEIIQEAFGGDQPAVAWLHYEPYNSPSKKLYKDILDRGLAAISEYREMKKNNSTAFVLSQAQMNSLGYSLLGDKRIKEAIEVFKVNTEDFPNSANTYNSLAEAYMIAGEKDLAIKNYEKSIELNPNDENGKEMLKKLKAP